MDGLPRQGGSSIVRGEQGEVMRVQIQDILAVASLFLCLACGGATANISAGEMPDEGTFNGVYHSPQYGEMHLVQNGSAVAGKYKSEMRKGKIQGEAEGDLLRFEWTEYKAMVSNRPQETRGHGYFRYVIDKGTGDHVLKGEWGIGDNEAGGGPWNMYKMKNREPDIGGDDDSSGGESGDGESEATSGSDDESSDDDLF
jgi:hypothetical protein